MQYPWWYIPHLTGPMLIAVVALLHVVVAHYAVGGGFFLAVETSYAFRTENRAYLDYLKRHARFFVLLTVVYGAITGVGIWWTIGLTSPLSTALLIRTFVFGWGIEYVFFVLEIVAAFILFYYWGRLPEKIHMRIAWIYAWAAWISLVLITGITAFMLHPGAWMESRDNFWVALLNPQTLPQIISRTGGALLLSSLYVYLHSSLTVRDARLHNLLESRSARPALLGAVMIAVGGVGWYVYLPESAKAVLSSAAVLNILVGLIFALTAVVFVLLYIGPYKNPGWLTPGFAGTLLLFGLAAFSAGEFIREAVRKPYVIYGVVLGNQVFPEQVAAMRREGFLESGVWTRAYVAQNYPQAYQEGRIDEKKLATLPREDQVKLGAVLFQHHCNDCHATDVGYSAVGPLLRGWTPDMIRSMLDHLDRAPFFMPPWSGTHEEADLLVKYLETLAPPRPSGMPPYTMGEVY